MNYNLPAQLSLKERKQSSWNTFEDIEGLAPQS